MKFQFRHPLKNTIKVNFALIMAAFAISTISICIITSLASNFSNRAIIKQDHLLERYRLAYNLGSAVHELLYYEASLSNSLSDPALDTYLDTHARLDRLTAELNEPALSDFINQTLFAISATTKSALSHYRNNDPIAGDAQMKLVRVSSAKLETRVLAYQAERLEKLESIQKITLSANQTIGRATTFFTVLALLTTGVLMLLVYRITIRPVHELVASLKQAIITPGNAKKYRVRNNSGGEIGEAILRLNSLLDATENALEDARSQAEKAKVSEANWRAIFKLSPDAVILMDQETTKIIDCNPATINMLDVAGKDFTQYSAFDFHTHEKEALAVFLAEIRNKGHARADDLSCKIGTKTIPVSVVGVDVPGTSNNTTMLYIRDMSENVAQRRELETAQVEAEQASEAKSVFLATMSHEIRTPLNGLLGMAQALGDSNLACEDADKVETIIESGDALMTILNDVLDISKISASQMEIAKIPGNLPKLVTQTCKLFAIQAEDKKLELAVSIHSDIPETLSFDQVRVRQCLTNLVSNALKFTQKGKVDIDVFLSDSCSDVCTVGVRVSDTGLGMDADTQKRIFSPFIQADSSISREFGGTGLGLAISHELAQLMGGDITVGSIPDKGSVFTFTFKAAIVEKEITNSKKSTKKPVKINLSDKKILLVDDSDINRKVMRTLLAKTGVNIVEAENGQEALDLLQAEAFDLVLLDMHMPVLNGPETIAYIRGSHETWTDIPVIAVTADAMLGDKERYLAMGLDGYITKPIDQRLLLISLFKALNKNYNEDKAIRKIA